jgi:hypothetical protein
MEREVSILAQLPRVWLVVVAAVALLAAACASGPSPGVGDDWHASYAVNICGREVEPFPEFDGGVHTHGDGLIHVHPTTPSEEGEGASLVEFFTSAGGALTENALQVPGDKPWRDGNICSDGRPGRVVVVVNQGPLRDDLETYVPQNGDRILVAFVPAGSPIPAVPPHPSSPTVAEANP